MTNRAWEIWIDTGGTFTDCIALTPERSFRRLKIPSNSSIKGTIESQPQARQLKVTMQWFVQRDVFQGFTITIFSSARITRKVISVDLQSNIIILDRPIAETVTGTSFELSSGEEVPVLATRLLTHTALAEDFPSIEMKLGSTRGTNAILERKGAKTGLIITKGFKDLLLIGTQQRPDLFALNIQKEPPLYASVEEVEERLESDGRVLVQLNSESIEDILKKFKARKIESVAIAFLNSHKNSAHECEALSLAHQYGFQYVSASHQLSRQIKILPRTETTVANAYLAPIIFNYLHRIEASLQKASLKVMTSAGGLIQASKFSPKDSLLSGPAGGVVGAATSAKLSGVDRLITFDMGGTSTDVSLYDQRYDYRYESVVGHVKILSPSLAIETIAAGGGSICSFDGHKFTVGPHSAGAQPGPACYGAGGPLTLTDVNLLLGKVNPAQFAVPLHRHKAEEELRKVMVAASRKSKRALKGEEVLNAFLQIANEKMAEAIRKVSVQQGHNPGEFTLLSFGGAGGQHACQLAQMLNMTSVLVPYDAGLLSAYGIGHARTERFAERLLLKPLKKTEDLDHIFSVLSEEGKAQLIAEGISPSHILVDKQLIFLRFAGQESTLEIPYKNYRQLVRDFRIKYESIFGHWLADREIEMESARVIVAATGYSSSRVNYAMKCYTPQTNEQQRYIDYGRQKWIQLFRWEQLTAGATIAGPAIVSSNNSTTVVEEGWQFVLDTNNNALMTQVQRKRQKSIHHASALLELYSNRFTAIAQEMGALLQRTSFSVNVKERLDFSCAVLDAQGYLIVNAPHIPVHLGSMGVCVREVAKVIKMKDGDVIMTNHPAFGGSHLPDVTLIKPVFVHKKLVGYVANRAHHAEIGGMKPGSMPADAIRLEQEGVIITPTWLVKAGQVQWEQVKLIFTSAKYPTRLLEENLADLNGALASVNFGAQVLQQLCSAHGTQEVKDHMQLLRQYAAEMLAARMKDAPRQARAAERLDDGAILKVRLQAKGKRLLVDFTGSAKQHPGNLNATKAIVQSVVLYCLRLWVNQPIAMNEGLLTNVHIILPHGLLYPDFSVSQANLPAVVGGNTEISQRLTDTLLKALKLSACSQGTMNNFLFGNVRFGYYETIGGGAGAGNGFDGAHGVHTHMTNTRITDPEILEHRYPVRLDRFELRKNSGGKGRWRGGDGLVRVITFKESVEINLLTQHRVEQPFGIKGASAGKTGKQYVIQKGSRVSLKGVDSILLNAGDTIVIETPGGGGWGK